MAPCTRALWPTLAGLAWTAQAQNEVRWVKPSKSKACRNVAALATNLHVYTVTFGAREEPPASVLRSRRSCAPAVVRTRHSGAE